MGGMFPAALQIGGVPILVFAQESRGAGFSWAKKSADPKI